MKLKPVKNIFLLSSALLCVRTTLAHSFTVKNVQALVLNSNPACMTKNNMLALGGATGFVAGALGGLLRDNSDSLVGRTEFIFLGYKAFGVWQHNHQGSFKADQSFVQSLNGSGPIFAYIAASAVGRVAGRVCARVLRRSAGFVFGSMQEQNFDKKE